MLRGGKEFRVVGVVVEWWNEWSGGRVKMKGEKVSDTAEWLKW